MDYIYLQHSEDSDRNERVFSSEPSYYANCEMFSDLPKEEYWED